MIIHSSTLVNIAPNYWLITQLTFSLLQIYNELGYTQN